MFLTFILASTWFGVFGLRLEVLVLFVLVVVFLVCWYFCLVVLGFSWLWVAWFGGVFGLGLLVV